MIVQCHGHFDLLHPGHIKHLRAAESLVWNPRFRHRDGILVVTLTTGKWMTKHGHPLFTDSERLEHMLSLKFVDQAFLIDSPDAISAIEYVRPDIYVKGMEYMGKLPEEEYCKQRGIQVRFLGKKIYGSTQLALQSGLLQSS